MKYTITVLAAFFVALSVAQWPCHDYGFNGAIANCASCNVLGNVWGSASWFSVCTNCTNGFFLNQSACVPCANNCTNCQLNGACKSGGCGLGFAYIPTNATCVPCPSSLNCGQCSYNAQGGLASQYGLGPFTCATCLNNGYYISSTGACVACPATCGQTVSAVVVASTTVPYSSGACTVNGCTACMLGYTLVGTTLVGVTTNVCTACATNCLTCANVGFCDIGGCAPGFGGTTALATTNTCAACSVTGCATCTAGLSSTCTACTAGLFLTVGGPTCATTVCTANCNLCATATTCTTCLAGYYTTLTGTCSSCPTNCTTCQSYQASPLISGGLCTACIKNTTLQNGACYSCPANCTSCALLSASATTTVCLQCQLGFGLNDTTGVCVPCGPSCDYCDGSGVCTQCRQATWTTSSTFTPQVAGVSFGGGSSNLVYTSAIPVIQGYFLPPNQCQQCPYNCSSCANSTFCYSNCTKNYVYNSTTNQCLPNGVERIVFAGFAFLTVIFYFV